MSRTIKNEAKYVKKRKSEKAKLSKKYRDFKHGSVLADLKLGGRFKVEVVLLPLIATRQVDAPSDSFKRNEVAA